VKHCECGCGQPTATSDRTRPERGDVKGEPRRFLRGHRAKLDRNPRPDEYRRRSQRTPDGQLRRINEHTMIVERVIGKRLPAGAEIHHVNGDRSDNQTGNLVVCQDHKYHMLLHRRGEAFHECGNANWLRCTGCEKWDDPENLVPWAKGARTWWHRPCRTTYQWIRRQK
jgi:hypothetical protein